MNLYQTHNGNVLEIRPLKEIGAIADGWKRADQHPRPLSSDIVDVVLRNGIRFENTHTSDFNWCLDGTEGDIVAFRIVPTNMQLEVGGIYKARDGSIHGPLRAIADDTYTFADESWSWTHDGIQYVGSKGAPLDLVEKIAVVPADTASEWLSWGEPGKPPIHADSLVEIVTRDGHVLDAHPTNYWCWSSHIVAYRVVRPAKPAFSLELGGIYKTRDGNICGPLHAAVGGGDAYPFTDATWSWMADGVYYRGQLSHPRDLVEKIAVVPAATANEWTPWNQPNVPDLPPSTIVEVVTRSGKLQAGTDARPVNQWFWESFEGYSAPYPILAYRVVPQAKLSLSIEERVARLEARLS